MITKIEFRVNTNLYCLSTHSQGQQTEMVRAQRIIGQMDSGTLRFLSARLSVHGLESGRSIALLQDAELRQWFHGKIQNRRLFLFKSKQVPKTIFRGGNERSSTKASTTNPYTDFKLDTSSTLEYGIAPQASQPEKPSESPQPITKTIPETLGDNEAVWTVDDQGRPLTVEATLKDTYKTERSNKERSEQANVGGESRLDDDQGGHMVGHRFMSDQGLKNLFPQNANLNMSSYKRMENEWDDWTQAGFEVKLFIELAPPNSDRPTDILVDYDVYDPRTGKRVYTNEHRFSNVAGEQFDRVPKSSIESHKS